MGEKISFIDLFGTELELEDEYAREQLADETAARVEDVAVLSARMDTFTALPSGSTAGDAELMDIRVGADGVTYANAGDAVRAQIGAVKTALNYIALPFENGGISSTDGSYTNYATRLRTVDFISNNISTLSVNESYHLQLFAWDDTDTYIGCWNPSNNNWVKANVNINNIDLSVLRLLYPLYKYKVVLRLQSNENIELSEYKNVIYSPLSIIEKDNEKAKNDISLLYGAVDNGYLTYPIDGGFVLGDTSVGNVIQSSSNTMVTQKIQTVSTECTINTDWSKYRVYVWEYKNSTWTGRGWYYSDVPIESGFVGRVLVRGLTTHNLTQEEQGEINAVTAFIVDTAISKKIDSLPIETGDFISICHQGYSETMTLGHNLLDGYKLAKEKGFEYGECDVILSSDNVVMCCHDETFVDQTTQETITIAEHTASELKTYNYYGGTIATFEEILLSCKENGIGLVIDHATNALLPYIFPIIKKYGMQKRVIYLIGWATGNPPYASNMYNSILAFYSKSDVMFMANTSTINEVVTFVNALAIGTNRVYITLNYSLFSVGDINTIISNLNGEYSVAVWTIDDVSTCKQYFPYVTAITSNKVSSKSIFTD